MRNELALTPELWAKVFAYLELRPDHINEYDASQQKRNQAEVHQLKLVCKQFKSIYESHSELVQRLYLGNHFSLALVPSLLAWLHQNKGSVRVFWSKCTSPVVDIVMAGLLSSPNINTVDIFDASACTVTLAGTYRGLAKCTLEHEKGEPVGLAPLGALPKLRQLMLQGFFKELHHLRGLTLLECESSRVSDAQELPPALQYLGLTDSDLVGVHAQTLPSCTALSHLLLNNARLKDNSAYVYLDENLSVVPANIGQLTQLKSLHLSTGMHAEAQFAELKWVSGLTSLQVLSMHFDHGNGNILQYMAMLTKLTYLYIAGFHVSNEAHLLDANVEWHKLQALWKVFIVSKRLSFGDNIYGLLKLPKLQVVSFAGSMVHGPRDINCLAALIDRFARLRPQLKLVLAMGMQ